MCCDDSVATFLLAQQLVDKVSALSMVCLCVCVCVCCSCSDTEIKQLNGWKATVENLHERFDDITKQIELLTDIELSQQACHSSRAAAAADADAAAAVAAEEGAAGPLAAGIVGRSGFMTAQPTVQRNKLR